MLRSLVLVLLALGSAPAAHALPLRVMSFNVWHAGSQVHDGPQKIVDAIVAADADVVGFQESEGWMATHVAAALGWYALQGPSSVAIASRFPITEVFPLARDASGLGARLDVGGGDVVVWVVHLGYTSYGPYAACDGAPTPVLSRGERASGRYAQMLDVLKKMKKQLRVAETMPVLLLGDFNAPSHLDWTTAAASLHCGVSMRWPVSAKVERADLIDVVRAIHPDPVTQPATTWSPLFPAPEEPQDRIDFVYAKGAVPLSDDAFVVGTPAPPPHPASNAWPSDHAAVVTQLEVAPTASIAGRAPTLGLNASTFGPDDPIVATVAFGPGNGTDWIGLYRAGDVPGEDGSESWRYLTGTQTAKRRGWTAAAVTFPAGTLDPGDYVAHFLYADGAGTMTPGVPFTVAP